MKTLASLFIFLITSIMLLNIQVHVQDSESFLNGLSSIDKNKDYDRDGATENVDLHMELIKSNQTVFWTAPLRIEFIAPALVYVSESLHIEDCPLILSDFQLQIFRPPIVA